MGKGWVGKMGELGIAPCLLGIDAPVYISSQYQGAYCHQPRQAWPVTTCCSVLTYSLHCLAKISRRRVLNNILLFSTGCECKPGKCADKCKSTPGCANTCTKCCTSPCGSTLIIIVIIIGHYSCNVMQAVTHACIVWQYAVQLGSAAENASGL